MGTATVMLAFQMKKGVGREDVLPFIPELLSHVLRDVRVVHPSSGYCAGIGPIVAVGNEGKSVATLVYHNNGLLSVDVQHECTAAQLVPMAEPYTLEKIRLVDRKIQKMLGDLCDHSVSLYSPIRRRCQGPVNYAVLGDEKLVETDYTHAVCDVNTRYQRVTVMQSQQFGKVLLLDDDVMFGESDDVYVKTVLGLDRGNDFAGSRVLILGGGDGGLLHALVNLPRPPAHVLMAEIDDEVMRACRQYMRSVCGDVMDNYKRNNYEIQVRDCVDVLKESLDKGVQFDYVVNDLTEFSVEKEKYGFNYDFQTNNVLMELSFKVLRDGGKYLARGNTLSAGEYVKAIERELDTLGAKFTRFDRHVPSFREAYCFFEATKPKSKSS